MVGIKVKISLEHRRVPYSIELEGANLAMLSEENIGSVIGRVHKFIDEMLDGKA